MNMAVRSIAISALLTLAAGLSMPTFAQNSNPSSANGAVASIAGTSWNAIETIGFTDVFDFLSDGRLHYTCDGKDYINGTWKQDGDTVYIEMNNKFTEYNGLITGTHIEGTAHNVRGKNWTWKADKR